MTQGTATSRTEAAGGGYTMTLDPTTMESLITRLMLAAGITELPIHNGEWPESKHGIEVWQGPSGLMMVRLVEYGASPAEG